MGKVIGIILIACMGFSAPLLEVVGERADDLLEAADETTVGSVLDQPHSVLRVAPKLAARTWRSIADSAQAADLDFQLADFVENVRRYKPHEVTFEPLEGDSYELQATVTIKGMTCYFYTRS